MSLFIYLFIYLLTSFFLISISSILSVGAQIYCTRSHPVTHIFCRTPLEEGSVHHRGLLTDNTQYSQQDIQQCLRAGFEPAISASELQQNRFLDRAVATGNRKGKKTSSEIYKPIEQAGSAGNISIWNVSDSNIYCDFYYIHWFFFI